MSLEEFLDGWMQPGASAKRASDRHRTLRGRRVLGEKGVGRFAADKLASRLEVTTRRKGLKEVHASFSWDDYDNDSRLLSEVKNTWEERSNASIPRRRGRHGAHHRARDLPRARWRGMRR
jgi:hypothetical protein